MLSTERCAAIDLLGTGVAGWAGSVASTGTFSQTAGELGVTCVKSGIPGYYEWIERRPKIDRAIKSIQVYRETLGPDIDIAVDFHAKTSPSVASIIVKEVEPLNLLFIEEPCPPENIQAMAKIARRSTTPIATGERP